jgi:hypothetical protein
VAAHPLLVLAAATLLALAGCSAEEPRPTSAPPSAPSSGLASASPTEPDPGPARPASRVEPVRPTSPRQAAEQLVAGDPRQQQVTYRELGVRPAWDRRVRSLLPRRLRAAFDHNVAARRDFRSMHSSLSDTLPAWRIVKPPPADELLGHYLAAERAYGVGWEYLAAINLVETAMGRIRGTSVAGARGPMQFMPATWARWGRGDIDDPADSIMAAARYLASNGFTRGPRGVARALFEYNNHPAYVRGVTHYAQVMEADPEAFAAYHRWRVVYLTTEGDVVLPVGYKATRPVPVRRYLRSHPQG